MTGSFEPLPEFDAPPVVEVVLGVAFEPAYQLTSVDLVQVWNDLYKSYFPNVTEKPPYDAPKETFHIQLPKRELITRVGLPPVRLWITSEGEQELIQLQHDWFARNWRKVDHDGVYPRYDKHIRPAFAEDLASFTSYVTDLGTELTPVQCEVSYVNHIRPGGPWATHRDIESLFQLLDTSAYKATFLESAAFKSSSLITTSQSSPIGRLHVQIDSAFDPAGDPLIVLNLTARGSPIEGSSNEAVMRFQDIGREHIVRTFVEITTEASHQLWRRTR